MARIPNEHELAAQIVECCNAGMNIRQTSKKLGRHYRVIRRHWPKEIVWTSVDPVAKEEIVRLARLGFTRSEIKRELKIGYTTIQKVLRQEGWTFKPNVRREMIQSGKIAEKRGGPPVPPEKVQAMQDAFWQGLTARQVAALHGVCYRTAQKYRPKDAPRASRSAKQRNQGSAPKNHLTQLAAEEASPVWVRKVNTDALAEHAKWLHRNGVTDIHEIAYIVGNISSDRVAQVLGL